MPSTMPLSPVKLDGRALFARWRLSSQKAPTAEDSKVLAEAALALAVFLLCLVALRPVGLRSLSTHLPGKNDTWMFVTVLQWDVHCLSTGHSWDELWSMPVLYPEANMLACSEHMLGSSLLYAPFLWLTRNPILAFNLWLLMIALLNYLTAWEVARHLLCDGITAILTAVLFTFGFVRLYHHGHQHLWPHFPTPLLFLAAVKMREGNGWRWPILAGCCLVVQFYLSIYLGYMAALMVALMLGVQFCVEPRRFRDGRFLAGLALASVLTVLAVLPLAFPYQGAAARWGCWSWPETMAWMPELGDLCWRSQREQCAWAGWIVCCLGLFGAAMLMQQWRARGSERFWLLCCCVLPVAILCLMLNLFSSYHALYKLLPGFQALRCPARMTLLAYWPSGLLAAWSLRQLLAYIQPISSWRRGLLSMAIVLFVFVENAAPLASFEARLPDQDLHRRVLRSLPPGALVEFPLHRTGEPCYWLMAERFATLPLTDWRPMLNAFTSKMPPWYGQLHERQSSCTTNEQVDSLLGELKLRGLRYVLLHRGQLAPSQEHLWRQRRAGVKLVHEDERFLIFDLEERVRSVCLPCSWASVQGPALLENKSPPAHYRLARTGDAIVTFAPVLPLRPGRYRVTFDVEGASLGQTTCEVVRGPREDVAAARSFSHDSGRCCLPLEVEIPERRGPESVLAFRVYKRGKPESCVRALTIEQMD